MSRLINVLDENYKLFQAALLLTGEEEEDVANRLICEYAHKAFESVIGKKTIENPNENYQVAEATITADEQKKLFVNWFRNLTRNGKAYNPVTISGYTGRLENACNDPTFSTVLINNLFTITDLTQFIGVQKQIKSCDGYDAFDAKSHNGFTAALRKYEEFLKYQADGNTFQNSEITTRLYAQPSDIHRWTMEEDEICCKRFLEFYVIKKSDMDIVQFLKILAKEVPDISMGSLRMKIQNIKYLSVRAGLKDTSTLKWLSQYSMQCEKGFNKALNELEIVKSIG